MKIFAIFAAILTTAISSLAVTNTLEKFSPPLSTNTPILWQAATNYAPKSIWVYRRGGPRVFSTVVISNAIVLGSLQSRGFPKPSTNDFFIWQDKGADYPGPVPSLFEMSSSNATLRYAKPDYSNGSQNDIPGDEAIVMRAWKCAAQLGLDRKQVMQEQPASHNCNYGENGREITNHLCGRGVYLSRLLDGIPFWGNGADPGTEGFWIEFGSRGIIRAFSLTWPNLERYESQPTASPQQIISCIRAQKVIVIPNGDEDRYFQRVRVLAKAKKFTITRVTPCYNEGVFGEMPAYNELPSYIRPIAELTAVADFGNSNMTVRILTPILSSDVARLLVVKAK